MPDVRGPRYHQETRGKRLREPGLVMPRRLRLAAAAAAPRFSHPPLPAFGFAPPTTLEPIVATSVFGAAPASLNAVCMDPPPSIDKLYEAEADVYVPVLRSSLRTLRTLSIHQR